MSAGGREFPVRVERLSVELCDIVAPGVRFTLCAHGARALAAELLRIADRLYCDGYRHGDEYTMYAGTSHGGWEPHW